MEDVLKEIRKSGKWYIYGAGIVAMNTGTALEKCYGVMPDAYLVTDKAESGFMEHNKLLSLTDFAGKTDKRDQFILIAVPPVYHHEIAALLRNRGFVNYTFLSDDMDYQIMSGFYRKTTAMVMADDLMPAEYAEELTGNRMRDILQIYMAKCVKDIPLRESYSIPEYIMPVQAGTDLSQQKFPFLQDNTGENISSRNRKYAELTVTYWVWKNITCRYKGICHYRRMLAPSDRALSALISGKADVLLPLPFYCPDGAASQYGRYVSSSDFEFMLQALKEIHPEDAADAERIWKGRYLYNYNMFIARQEIFDSYCSWLFPVLERADTICDPHGKRQDRYIGYLGELLTSYYFQKYRNEMKTAHTGRVWMV